MAPVASLRLFLRIKHNFIEKTGESPFLFFFYFIATSSIIIKINPIATPIVPPSPSRPLCASGINSSTVTYIIAPAANDNIYGNIGDIIDVKNIVIIAPIGSTAPDNAPYEKAFFFDIPPL